jgi:hypothetical protein
MTMRPNVMWGADATRFYTERDGLCWFSARSIMRVRQPPAAAGAPHRRELMSWPAVATYCLREWLHRRRRTARESCARWPAEVVMRGSRPLVPPPAPARAIADRASKGNPT